MRNDDLISRTAAIRAFTSKPPEYYHTSYIVSELNSVPAVDAMPVVHGHWIIHPDVCVYSKRNEDSPGIFIWRPCNEVRPHDMWFCAYGKQEASEDEAMED